VEFTVDVRAIGGEDPVALRLLAAMEDNVGRVYGPVEGTRTSVVAPSEMVPPHGEYVALWVDGDAVAGGGLRTLSPGVGEVKRMWVDPEWRGAGLGRRLLAEIEAAGARLGFGVLRLDTAGPALTGFYERAGYAPIPDYNGNSYATFWGEKVLG
jgi:GNAT superfamily N-acetyltransferase